MAWQNPKTDWVTNPKNPVAEDFNRIEGNIDFLKQDIETKKGAVVNAINDMNQTADITNTYDELANKIRAISSDANAAVGDVLSGKTFYQGGLKRTGTMPNHGSKTFTPSDSTQTSGAGYYSGITVNPRPSEGCEYGNVTPGDVIKGVTFGTEEGLKTGTLELTGNAAASQVLTGRTFYTTNPKSKLTGTMPNYGSKTFTPSDSTQTSGAGYYSGITVNPRPSLSGNASTSQVLSGRTFYGSNYTKQTGTMPNRGAVTNTITTQGGSYTIPAGYHNGSGKVTASFSNLSAGNVKKGVNIGGIVGTLKPAPTLSHTNIIASRILRDPNNDYIGLMIEKPSSFTMNVGDSYTNSSFLFIQYYTGVVHSDARFTISVTSGTIYVMSVYSTTSTRATVTPSTPYTTPHSQFAILNPERVTTTIRFSAGTYSKDVYRGTLIS